MLGQDLLSAAARLAGLLASGETLQGSQPSECLTIAQDMIDEWQTDRLKVFCENINTYPFVLGTQTYTFGPGGTFAIPIRPAHVSRMGCQILSNPSQPSEVPITMLDVDGWANVRVKNIAGSYPLFCYNDYAYPLMNLNFWVIPGLACNCVIYSWQPISTFPDMNTTNVTFPPAYAQALKYNLAVKLMAEYNLPPNALVVGIAQNSLMALKELNLPAPILRCDPGLSGTGVSQYDWRADVMIVRR